MSGSILEQKDVLVSEGKDICFAKFAATSDVGSHYVSKLQTSHTDDFVIAHAGDACEATIVDIDLCRRGSAVC